MRNANAPGPVARPAGRKSTATFARILTPSASQRDLTYRDAKRIACDLYATDSRAVVELLLLAHREDVPTLQRYQANMALEWFDPSVELPTPAHLTEPPALRAIRWSIYAHDPEARQQAAAAAVDHLERWR